MHVFQKLLLRDLLLYIRRKGEWVLPFIFFIMIESLFPMALGSDPILLKNFAPAVIWIGVVLSLMLSLEGVFRSDFQDGFLEQLALCPSPLPLLMLSKALAHSIAMGLPLLLLAPIVGLFFNLPYESIKVLIICLLLGIPTFSLVGSLGASLTIGLHRGGLLIGIIILPLLIPIIIFGASGVHAATQGLVWKSEVYLLAALLLLSLLLAPIMIASALRISIE